MSPSMASARPGLTISGGGTVRVFDRQRRHDRDDQNLILTNGYGWQLAGGVLNNGSLTLDHVVVTKHDGDQCR
jgi:hypothetical protein